MTPSKIGIIRNIPFPQILKMIMTESAINARNQLEDAFVTADGARLNPIQIIIGPVTTGGKKRMTFLMPASLMTSARMRYSNPAITMPPQA